MAISQTEFCKVHSIYSVGKNNILSRYCVHAYISVDVHHSTAEKSKFIMWVQITVALNIQYLLWMKRDYQDTNRFIASLMPLFIHSFIGVYTVWSIVLELEKKNNNNVNLWQTLHFKNVWFPRIDLFLDFRALY